MKEEYCHWCGVSLKEASEITYINGNLPVCDLCLMKDNKEKETVPISIKYTTHYPTYPPYYPAYYYPTYYPPYYYPTYYYPPYYYPQYIS
jgi:hypothetical protein